MKGCKQAARHEPWLIEDGAPLGDVTSLQNPWAVEQVAALVDAARTVLPSTRTRHAEESA